MLVAAAVLAELRVPLEHMNVLQRSTPRSLSVKGRMRDHRQMLKGKGD